MKFWKPVKDRVQRELIERGHCVGCTKSLATADREPYYEETEDPEGSEELVTCSCGRVYLYDKQINHYQRATQEEYSKHQQYQNP